MILIIFSHLKPIISEKRQFILKIYDISVLDY